LGNHSADDPFGEDYSDIAKHGIVDVFSEGDLVGRLVHVSHTLKEDRQSQLIFVQK